MYLTKLIIENFRCFGDAEKRFELCLTEGLTALVGENDSGKTAVGVVELAIDKGATMLLMPLSSRRPLFELPDDMATKMDVQFYSDSREALIKALCE